jgi:hypothetical protein
MSKKARYSRWLQIQDPPLDALDAGTKRKFDGFLSKDPTWTMGRAGTTADAASESAGGVGAGPRTPSSTASERTRSDAPHTNQGKRSSSAIEETSGRSDQRYQKSGTGRKKWTPVERDEARRERMAIAKQQHEEMDQDEESS